MALEGVGPINAINLFLLITCPDEVTYADGKDVAASIGVTPVQHLSGGKTKIGHIRTHSRNATVRSQLITGAFTYINWVMNKPPKTQKDKWLQSLVARRGKKCTAVALANKTVRTAFSMLKKGTAYNAQTLNQS